ncbi:MAG: aminopeptidase, partial [Sarcina sp.]
MVNSKDLMRKEINAWKKYSEEDKKELFLLSDRYREFMSTAKTERECVNEIIKIVEENGFKDLKEIIDNGKTLKAGDKVYSNNMGKTLAMFVIGTESIEKGLNIVGSHVDAPRIDLKQNPLYEDSELALMETHYYGGIKKYQWVAMPLAMHGVVVKKDGSIVNIVIGENDDEPVVGISDLLPHLAADQMTKKASVVIEGENLNLLVGSMPVNDEDIKEKVKTNILILLNEKYNIDESDFVSSEFEIVPAGKARDFGLDRSMIMAYGQDDRICAYTSLEAILSLEGPDKTCVALFVDKEEIGSVGATGMHSRFFENIVAELMDRTGNYSELKLRRCLQNSKVLSADVSAAYDPNFTSVVEKKNCAYFGKGVVFSKYTGSRGKSGC